VVLTCWFRWCRGRVQTTKFPRFNIALVDKLPGGLEAENPVLKTNRPQAADVEAQDGKGKEKDFGEPRSGLAPAKDKPTTWFEHVRTPPLHLGRA
jgi:hypothetical protein